MNYLMALMTHGPVSTATRRRVRISADRRPTVRESDADDQELGMDRRDHLGNERVADHPDG
jgi:hypothetical protein